MSTALPPLKTGIAAQHPLQRTLQFATRVLTFVDGQEQRTTTSGPALRSWSLSFNQLDEAELWAQELAFVSAQGGARDVAFTDPFDGTEYPMTYFAGEQLELELTNDDSGRTNVEIRESRG